jgi:hypothetical protein
MDIVEILMLTNRSATSDAALAFARAGVPIFPCVADGKRPLTGTGFHEAARDFDQVRRWWNRWPKANIGVPTGVRSGIDVVDIDVGGTASGFTALERATHAGLIDGELARVRTPSGGLHIYYPADASKDQRCWQAASTHIDFRGNGGYVVVPPSTLIRDQGRVRYQLFSLSTAGGNPIDAVALRQFVDPQSPRAGSRPPVVTPLEPTRLARWVGHLQEGERNRGLFWAACRLAEAGFEITAIEDALAPSAASAGLRSTEITATIRSATRRVTSQSSGTSEPSWRERDQQRRKSGEAPCLP